MKELVSLSKGRAVCSNSARTDPWGGCQVTDIPIATPRPLNFWNLIDEVMPIVLHLFRKAGFNFFHIECSFWLF